jgi:predicted metal-dependent hydrolase
MAEISEDADLQVVSQALNRYWSVDQAAAVQLLRDCRRARPDARADEIAFFVREKLEIARTSKTITNPTGLILATVPQCFVGATFNDFRRRMERHAKLAAEEVERKQQQQEELRAWIMKDRERYESIVSDPSKTQQERDDAEKRLREIAAWDD